MPLSSPRAILFNARWLEEMLPVSHSTATGPKLPRETSVSTRTIFKRASLSERRRGFFQPAEEFYRVNIQGVSNIEEFHNIQPPFAALILGDVGLRARQFFCEVGLRELCCLPSFNQENPKPLVFFRECRLRHRSALHLVHNRLRV